MKKLIIISTVFVLSGCRGDKSSAPPVLLIRNMVEQTSYGPQSKNEFFKDKKSTRAAVAGTVAEGEANTNSRLYKGVEENTSSLWVKQFPIILTEEVLKRGQDRYNIYCTACHGYTANNDGLATQAAGGSIRPANLHDSQFIEMPVGKIYNAVTNGVNNWNMPGFAEQIDVQDRWAVVAYVRALQASRLATAKDVPANVIK
ncbi:MAG: cytochrome c [Bdellovibrionota bacterium]